MIVLDWGRPFAATEDRNAVDCAVIDKASGYVTACRRRWSLTDGLAVTGYSGVQCQRCRDVVAASKRQSRSLWQAIDHSAAKACRPQPQPFVAKIEHCFTGPSVDGCYGGPLCPCRCIGCLQTKAMCGMVFAGDMPSLVDHELEQLQRLAAPAMPRTTAVDLPAFDVSDETTTGSK